MKKIKTIFFFLILSQCCYSQHWDSLAGTLDDGITLLTVDSITNKLYAGGTFTHIGNLPIQGIAAWNGNQWDSLSKGIDYDTVPTSPNNTHAVVRYGNYLYVGGAFSRVGNFGCQALARWDGTNWDTVSGGKIHGYHVINDIKVYNNELYICGDFDSIGNVPAKGIAKWDGNTWQAVGNNYNFVSPGYLTRMMFYHGNLYAGGNFRDPNNATCRLAKWDGTNWQFMTNDLHGAFAILGDMEVYNDKLYVGGLFYASDGNAGNSIMSWNDTTWSDVGGSIQMGPNNPYPTIFDCVFTMGNYIVLEILKKSEAFRLIVSRLGMVLIGVDMEPLSTIMLSRLLFIMIRCIWVEAFGMRIMIVFRTSLNGLAGVMLILAE